MRTDLAPFIALGLFTALVAWFVNPLGVILIGAILLVAGWYAGRTTIGYCGLAVTVAAAAVFAFKLLF